MIKKSAKSPRVTQKDRPSETASAGEEAGTRSKLVAAAVELFSARGYDGVSLREIEIHAGINRGVAAYHFGTKDGLWRAAIDRFIDLFEAEMFEYQGLLPLLPQPERTRVVLRIFARWGAQHPQFARLFILHGNDESERGDWFIGRMRPTFEFIRRMTGTGELLPPADEALLYGMFLGAAVMLSAAKVQSKAIFGIDPSEPGQDERIAEAVLNLYYPYFTGTTELSYDLPSASESKGKTS